MTGKRTTATAVLKLMTPAQRVALVEFFYDRWENAAQADELGELCNHIGIDRLDLAEAAGLVRREWIGAGG